MAEAVIRLEHVTFRYTGMTSPVLDDVSLAIYPGEFVGVIGSTGCGKTTLLYLMSGVIPHYLRGELSGEVFIYGRPSRELSLAKIVERVGIVLQDPEAQLFNLFVRDEIAWGLENRGLPRPEIAARIESTLAFFGVEALRDRVTYDLSGGEKQRVAMAANHAVAPEVYLFDNPTSQLDPIGAATVIEAVRRLIAARGTTIVMVEDKVDELVEHADRLVLLDRGRIALDCGPREFCLQREALEAAGVRPPQIAELTEALIQAGVALDDLPITLDEAVPVFQRLLARRGSVEHDGFAPSAGQPAADRTE